MFSKTCVVGVNFKKWLQSPGGGGKGESQADQLLCKVLKYLKYCCADVSISWDIPESVVDYCLGSVTMISDFAEYLQTNWSLKSSGVTGSSLSSRRRVKTYSVVGFIVNVLRLNLVFSKWILCYKYNGW